MKAPACDPGDLCIALRAQSTLLIPEIAKSTGTPKRFQHVSLFAFFEVGFIGWIVLFSFSFDLDVSFDGSALCAVQPHLARLSLVIIAFPEETPVVSPIALIVFLSEPGRGPFRMPSPCPLPQTVEDRMINV